MRREEGIHGEEVRGGGSGREEEARRSDSQGERKGKEEGEAAVTFPRTCATDPYARPKRKERRA
jgi:hypothetical protein